MINNCLCIVGNSSSGLREAAFLGVPCVNIGSRQSGRERAANVIDVGHDAEAIAAAVRHQMGVGRYAPSALVGDGSAGERIAEILATAPLSIHKTIGYLCDTPAPAGSQS